MFIDIEGVLDLRVLGVKILKVTNVVGVVRFIGSAVNDVRIVSIVVSIKL